MTNEEIKKHIEENLGKLKTDFEAKEMIVYRALVDIFKAYNYPESVIIDESEYLEAVQEAKGIGNIERGVSRFDPIRVLKNFGYLETWHIACKGFLEKKKGLESLEAREPVMISRFITNSREINDSRRVIQLVATPIFKAQVFPKKDILKTLSVLKASVNWVKEGRKDGVDIYLGGHSGIEEQLRNILLGKYQLDLKKHKVVIKLVIK